MPQDTGAQEQFPAPTEHEMNESRARDKWMDALEFQPDDLPGAMERLGIASAEFQHLEGMSTISRLEKWQTLVVDDAVTKLDSYYSAVLLADHMGIGKTHEALGVLQHHINRFDKARAEERETDGKAKPTLIVAPHGLLGDWAEKIVQFFPLLKVYYYHGSKKQDAAPGTIFVKENDFIEKKHEIFQAGDECIRSVVLTSPQTFANRHGPHSLKRRRQKMYKDEGMTAAEAKKKADEKFDVPDSKWDRDLSGCFRLLIVDEPHQNLSNPQAGYTVAIQWLKCRYRMLLTGTPIRTNKEDLLGLLSILQRPGAWSKANLRLLGVSEDATAKSYNPWTECNTGSKPARLRVTLDSFQEHVLGRTDEEVGISLRVLFEPVMIRRTLRSKIPKRGGPNAEAIGDRLPPVNYTTRSLNFDRIEEETYRELHDQKEWLTKTKEGQVKLTSPKFLNLQNIETWLKFKDMFFLKIEDCNEIRKAGSSSSLAEALLKKWWEAKTHNIQAGLDSGDELEYPDDFDQQRILNELASGSPKLREIGAIAAELCAMQKEKLLIFCYHPAQQLFSEAVSICLFTARTMESPGPTHWD